MTRRIPVSISLVALFGGLLLAAPAHAKPVEGGIYGETTWFGSARTQALADRHFPVVSCVGLNIQSRGGWRAGGEGSACWSPTRAHFGGMYLGPRFGYLAQLGGFRIGTMVGIGMGVFDDRSAETGHRTSLFLYAKPGLTMGFQLGGLALEGELYAMLPLQLAQFVHTPASPSSISQAGIGVRLGVLFGKSPKRVREERAQQLAEQAALAAQQRAQLAAQAQPTTVPPASAPASSDDPPVYTTPDLPGMPPSTTSQPVSSPLAIPASTPEPAPLEAPPAGASAAAPASQPSPAPAADPPLAIPATP